MIHATPANDKPLTTVTAADWKAAMGPKRNILKILITSMLTSVSAAMAHEDLLLLEAIAAVESGNNHCAVSPSGCVSCYQITPTNWLKHSGYPVADAIDPAKAQHVAVKHLKWIRDTLASIGIKATQEAIIAAWRYGPNGNLTSPAAKDYVERVQNILRSRKTSLANAPSDLAKK